MLTVETIRKIRLSIHRDGKSIRQTAKELRVSRNTALHIAAHPLGMTDAGNGSLDCVRNLLLIKTVGIKRPEKSTLS
jgi:hypothetical protein